MTIKMTPELAAYLALPESEKKALAQAVKNEKGVLVLNKETVEALQAKAGLPENAGLSYYVSTKGPRTMQLIVAHSATDKQYFKLGGGKHSDNQDMAIVDIQNRIATAIAKATVELKALEQAGAFFAKQGTK